VPCEGYGHYTYEYPSIKCFKCGEFEHYHYQCPSKDNVQIDDINNLKIVEDVHIASEVTSDVLMVQ